MLSYIVRAGAHHSPLFVEYVVSRSTVVSSGCGEERLFAGGVAFPSSPLPEVELASSEDGEPLEAIWSLSNVWYVVRGGAHHSPLLEEYVFIRSTVVVSTAPCGSQDGACELGCCSVADVSWLGLTGAVDFSAGANGVGSDSEIAVVSSAPQSSSNGALYHPGDSESADDVSSNSICEGSKVALLPFGPSSLEITERSVFSGSALEVSLVD